MSRSSTVASTLSLRERSAAKLLTFDAFSGELARRRSTALAILSSDEELMVIWAPSWSAFWATAKPMPDVPPISKMFLPASLLVVVGIMQERVWF